MRIIRIKILHAQNVGRVLVSRKKSSWLYFMPFQAFLSMGRKHDIIKNVKKEFIFLGGPMGPIQPIIGYLVCNLQG